MLNVSWTVHNISKQTMPVKADVNGEVMEVQTACVEMELVPVNTMHGSVTLRFVGLDSQDAFNRFKAGDVISWML